MTTTVFEPAFVEFVPTELEPGVLYLALEHSVVVHLCACGCGTKVVTPLSPAQWQMSFDGDGVTLQPSIGNWQYPCRSHYWIWGNAVEWAAPMSDAEIEACRRGDAWARERYYGEAQEELRSARAPGGVVPSGWWRRAWRALTRRR